MADKYSLVTSFKGFTTKPDPTNVEASFMVDGSQNVLINDGEKVAVRQGYTLDGDANAALTPIESSYDWFRHTGDERHLRAYDDELEYRYETSAGVVTWRRLADAFTSVAFNFAEFWDNSELIQRLLMVNGTSNVYDWSGGVTTYASSTGTTLTKEGTTTWAQEGFYTSGTRAITINGVSYAYTGGEGTTTLTGLTAFPGATAGDIIHQTLRTTANSTMTGIPATFANAVIGVLNNQVYVGSFSNNSVYVSQVNSFTNYSFATPRAVGEGAILTLDSTPVAFVPQEEQMYISAGLDYWYRTLFQLSADNTDESLTIKRLKTTAQEAAQSQAMVAKIKNNVVYISNEPTLDTLGRLELIDQPQSTNISDPIKPNFDAYDFTDGSAFYFQNYIYVAVPAEGFVLMYNLAKTRWEAPQLLPVGRFAIINGELYGHSAQVPETYKLFDSYADNGQPIDARAYFAYNQYGDPSNNKSFLYWYTEGYISTNTTLTQTNLYDYGGHTDVRTFQIEGSDTSIIFNAVSDGSLGKNSVGTFSLAGRGVTEAGSGLSKFRVVKQTAKEDFYEMQIRYSSNNVDQRWELLRFGPCVALATSSNSPITQ